MAATCDALSITSLVARKLLGASFSLVRKGAGKPLLQLYWIHIFYDSEFWTCACPENFPCIEIFFIFQDFWATCACPEIFKPGGVPPPPPRAPLCLTSQMLTAKSCFKSTKNKWLSISLLTALRNIWNFDRDNLHACAPMSTPIWFISLFLRTSKFYVRMPSFLSHYWILAWLMSERRYSWGAVKVFCSYQCWLCANTYSACL